MLVTAKFKSFCDWVWVAEKSAVVICVDGVGASSLGPYGNTWIETPAFNRLASHSILMEYLLADSPNLNRVYRAWLKGLHALSDVDHHPSLVSRLSAADVRTVVVTDDKTQDWQDHFGGSVQLAGIEPHFASLAADDINQTEMARFFSEATRQLAVVQEPTLFWLHARGMYGAWDAPAEFRERFVDDEDPPPPDFVEPPNYQLPESFDPDERLGVAQAYAGQISLLDICLDAFLKSVDEFLLPADTLLIFTSARGFPLGEHGRIGLCDAALYSELSHVPLLIRLPDEEGAGQRFQNIAQCSDLHATLEDWFELPTGEVTRCGRSLLSLGRGEEFQDVQWAFTVAAGQSAIRTPAWYYRFDPSTKRDELYAKPDDRWEVNEVANLRSDIVALLRDAVAGARETLQAGDLSLLAPLADILVKDHE